VKRTWLRNGTMQVLRLLACGVFVTALTGCEGQIIGPPTPPGTPPPERASWLSYKYSGNCVDCAELKDKAEEEAYYCSIGVTGGSAANGVDPVHCPAHQTPTLTFNDWKVANGFGTPDARAVYGNLGDLRIARDMNCLKSSSNGNIACYVTNYGPAIFDELHGVVNPDWLGSNNFPGLTQGIEDAIAEHAPFATVAMVYNQSAAMNNSANTVTFYVFKGNGDLLFSPALDGEGGKTNPRMCMACHGGDYNSSTHSVTGAQFLPFDVFFFQYSSQAGYRFEDQQEAYRKLNALVNDTEPAPAIAEFINRTYTNAVQIPLTPATDKNPPPGWDHDTDPMIPESAKDLYNSVYRQYCRMCHMASHTAPFLTFADFKSAAPRIEEKVCQSTDMPHAQVPFLRFWGDKLVGQVEFRKFLTDAGLTNLHSCN
jgi:hypothetical protein